MPTRLVAINGDPMFLALLVSVLADAGYEPHMLCVGIAAVERVRTLAPTALIVDMPEREPEPSWQMLTALDHERALQPFPFFLCIPATAAAQERVAPYRSLVQPNRWWMPPQRNGQATITPTSAARIAYADDLCSPGRYEMIRV